MLYARKHHASRPNWVPGIVLLSFALLSMLGCFSGSVWADEKVEKPAKVEYKDIYLTNNRVCKACRWEWVDKKHVRLINRAGKFSDLSAKEVIGMDRHPIIRRAYLHTLYGIGLPGPIIVPAAFADGNDYVCKYCDSFGR